MMSSSQFLWFTNSNLLIYFVNRLLKLLCLDLEVSLVFESYGRLVRLIDSGYPSHNLQHPFFISYRGQEALENKHYIVIV